MQASKPVIIEINKKAAMLKISFEKESERFFAETELKAGNKSSTKTIAKIKAIKLISTDSPRNCATKDFFSAPSTLRIPTSDERLEERAVERFMKLIHAINKVNIAMEARMYKYVTLPPCVILPFTSSFK